MPLYNLSPYRCHTSTPPHYGAHTFRVTRNSATPATRRHLRGYTACLWFVPLGNRNVCTRWHTWFFAYLQQRSCRTATSRRDAGGDETLRTARVTRCLVPRSFTFLRRGSALLPVRRSSHTCPSRTPSLRLPPAAHVPVAAAHLPARCLRLRGCDAACDACLPAAWFYFFFFLHVWFVAFGLRLHFGPRTAYIIGFTRVARTTAHARRTHLRTHATRTCAFRTRCYAHCLAAHRTAPARAYLPRYCQPTAACLRLQTPLMVCVSLRRHTCCLDGFCRHHDNACLRT